MIKSSKIKDYPDYIIYSNGKIYSRKTRQLIKPNLCSTGYLMVSLRNEAGVKSLYPHRLVAQAFIPNPDNLLEVDHKNCDRTNNDMSNLRWSDREDNMKNRDYYVKYNSAILCRLLFEAVGDIERDVYPDWFVCDSCSYQTGYPRSLEVHCLSKKHQSKSNPQSYSLYRCPACNFNTKLKEQFREHVKTQQHIEFSEIYFSV